MLSHDGKVLFEDEFENCMTVFFVMNSDYVWKMYTTSEHPKKVGSEYTSVAAFKSGRALVAEKGQAVTIIDTDGKVIKKLDKIQGKEEKSVCQFSDGYAIFKTTDDLMGVIDEDGNCVLKPEYLVIVNGGDGMFIAADKKYWDQNDISKVKLTILNASGEVVSEIPADKFKNCDTEPKLSYGKLTVKEEKDGEEAWGIIDYKGETLVKPSVKIKEIGEIRGDLFSFMNSDRKWGLMNVKGETLIRAKYDALHLDVDNKFWVMKRHPREVKIVDSNGDQIGEDTYVDMFPFCYLVNP